MEQKRKRAEDARKRAYGGAPLTQLVRTGCDAYAHFGTYSVNEADKTVMTRVQGSWFPNLSGMEQKRIIASITADELRYTNPATATGTTAEVVWKRMK